MAPPEVGSVAPRRRLGILALFVLLGACYDHRFTQAIIERNRRARQAEGAKIQAARASTPKGGMRRGRVRFYVAKPFTEQHREWRHAISSLLDAANGVLGPNFALQLELEAISEWQPKCDPAHLDGCVAELAKLEAGEDGDWIGLRSFCMSGGTRWGRYTCKASNRCSTRATTTTWRRSTARTRG